MKQKISTKNITYFAQFLENAEYSPATISKYLSDVRHFAAWLNGRTITKEETANWKSYCLTQNLEASTINGKIAAVNAFLRYLDLSECLIKPLKIQRKIFREPSRELSKSEYAKLLQVAQNEGKERLLLIMETICATGIRVSEVKYITKESLNNGKAEITLKGKVRLILIPQKLCRKLNKYARKKKITSGEIFLTGGGKSLSRKQIWAEMKALCKKANVEPSKVFPHNLRHLFAKSFYHISRDIAKLADVLGHSSIETTRIYLRSSGEEHARLLDRLHLLL